MLQFFLKENVIFCFVYNVARISVAEVDDSVDLGRPALQLALPALHGRERYDDEKGTVQVVLVEHVREERDRLNCLAQAHFVR